MGGGAYFWAAAGAAVLCLGLALLLVAFARGRARTRSSAASAKQRPRQLAFEVSSPLQGVLVKRWRGEAVEPPKPPRGKPPPEAFVAFGAEARERQRKRGGAERKGSNTETGRG